MAGPPEGGIDLAKDVAGFSKARLNDYQLNTVLLANFNSRILSRPTVQHDPLAVALDRLAAHLADPRDHTDRKDLVA